MGKSLEGKLVVCLEKYGPCLGFLECLEDTGCAWCTEKYLRFVSTKRKGRGEPIVLLGRWCVGYTWGMHLAAPQWGRSTYGSVWGGFCFPATGLEQQGAQYSILSCRVTWEGAGGNKVSFLPSPTLAGVLPVLGGRRIDTVEASRKPFP